jgi:hypothetical protein
MKAWLRWTVVAPVFMFSCSSIDPSTPEPPLNGVDAASVDASALVPGEVCNPNSTTPLRLSFDYLGVSGGPAPQTLVLAPGQSRPVTLTVQPDLCSPATVTLSVTNTSIATASPTVATLSLQDPTFSFDVVGTAIGTTTVTASLQGTTDASATAAAPELKVVVQSGVVTPCNASDGVSGTITGSSPVVSLTGEPGLLGVSSLALASLSVPPGAFTRTDELQILPFPAQVQCTGDDLTIATHGHPAAPPTTPTDPAQLVAIGPAVTFTSTCPSGGKCTGTPLDMTRSLRRELDFTLPVNPAAIPPGGRLRHLQVLFMSPGGQGIVKTPRTITIASPRIFPSGSGYAVHFSSPWLGTYQAAYPADAGLEWRTRHVTHRAIVGISMGAGGAATFGMRHHSQFDVIAPMGGPSDWTWLTWFMQSFDLGGFCPVTNPLYPNCTTYAPNLYPFHETYTATEDFNHWYYQPGSATPLSGNGGPFGRDVYTEMFGDLALMLGDPLGQNADPSLAFLPAGPASSDLWVKGQATDPALPKGVDCRVTLLPVDGAPNEKTQEQWQSECNASRCANPFVLPTGYFDRQYNPDGSKQVISFCDSNSTGGTSPYADTWIQPVAGQGVPDDVALAVDLNGDGVREANEPILQQGAEPWSDTGTDGLFDVDEPGYDPINNPDPNQDDYDFQLNPNGTENNHRYDTGEPFLDYGLDGVKGTPQQAEGGYDVGEGDGMFTIATGLQNFYAVDPHSILQQRSTNLPSGPLTDSELLRFDVWGDGGVRDLFNFAAAANHLEGAIAGRLRADGTQLRTTAFYNAFNTLPGQVLGNEAMYSVDTMAWADLVDAPSVRYGTLDDPSSTSPEGDGQEVGTPQQIQDRLTTAIFFAAQRWPDADRTLTETTNAIPQPSTEDTADGGIQCAIGGPKATPFAQCSGNFTGPVSGHTGQIVVQLPPGYALEANVKRDVRYPVVYLLHGYEQTPADLQNLVAMTSAATAMNDSTKSSATRLAKMIFVYVDGSCQVGQGGWPECIRGTFWLDSNRPNGAKVDTWLDEVVDYVDQNYRTMGPSDLSVLE